MRRHSKGIYEFATPPHHYRNMSSRYRLLVEQGRLDGIAGTIRTDSPVMCSRDAGFDRDEYMRWAPMVYHHVEVNRWSPDYWMLRDSSFLSITDFTTCERVYEGDKKALESLYVPVSWTTPAVTEYDVRCFARCLMSRSDRNVVPLYYFTVRRNNGVYVLYARTSWLETFRTGRDLINYYRVAITKSFRKVYGFD